MDITAFTPEQLRVSTTIGCFRLREQNYRTGLECSISEIALDSFHRGESDVVSGFASQFAAAIQELGGQPVREGAFCAGGCRGRRWRTAVAYLQLASGLRVQPTS